MSKGLLVPDELVLELFAQRLAQPDAKNGAIFDGYPRTVPQAEALDELLGQAAAARSTRWCAIEVPLDEMIERIVLRRICEACGQIYHLRYNPPPSPDRCSCGGKLVQRTDDTEEVVRKRFEEYLTQDRARCSTTTDRRAWSGPSNGVGSLDEVTGRASRSGESAMLSRECTSERRHDGAEPRDRRRGRERRYRRACTA